MTLWGLYSKTFYSNNCRGVVISLLLSLPLQSDICGQGQESIRVERLKNSTLVVGSQLCYGGSEWHFQTRKLIYFVTTVKSVKFTGPRAQSYKVYDRSLRIFVISWSFSWQVFPVVKYLWRRAGAYPRVEHTKSASPGQALAVPLGEPFQPSLMLESKTGA